MLVAHLDVSPVHQLGDGSGGVSPEAAAAAYPHPPLIIRGAATHYIS